MAGLYLAGGKRAQLEPARPFPGNQWPGSGTPSCAKTSLLITSTRPIAVSPVAAARDRLLLSLDQESRGGHLAHARLARCPNHYQEVRNNAALQVGWGVCLPHGARLGVWSRFTSGGLA